MKQLTTLILVATVLVFAGCASQNEPHLPPISSDQAKIVNTESITPSPEPSPMVSATPEMDSTEASVVLGSEDTPDLGKPPIEKKEVSPKSKKQQKLMVVSRNNVSRYNKVSSSKVVETVIFTRPITAPTPNLKPAKRPRWVYAEPPLQPQSLPKNEPRKHEESAKKGFINRSPAPTSPSPEPAPINQSDVASEPDTGCVISTDRHWYIRYQGQWVRSDAYCQRVVITEPNRKIREQAKKRCGFLGSLFKSDCP